jgi:O-glycosyl hydrolase
MTCYSAAVNAVSAEQKMRFVPMMTRFVAASLLIAFSSIHCHAQNTPSLSYAPVTITVQPGARQTFRGFGVSLIPGLDGFAALSPVRRREMARLIWRDHHIKILRLWLDVPNYSPKLGVENDDVFVDGFVKDDAIALAKANGVTTLLLAPDHYPLYMSEPKPRTDGQTYICDEQIPVWTDMLAGFIGRMRDHYGVQINATGIVNEPGQEKKYSVTQMAVAVKYLRGDLDKRGLGSVQIVAPESSNTAVGADELSGYIAAIEADPAAFHALGGVATHNYNNGNTDDVEAYVARTGKPYWITEAGGDGAMDKPNDAVSAASAATRFLSDMDHLVTHWVWFLGGEAVREPINDPNAPAGGSRMIQYKTDPITNWYRVMQVSYPLQQLSEAFDPGAVVRNIRSSLDANMSWSFGRKPHLTASAARNPDGSWGIGLSNYTANDFPDFDQFHKDNAGYAAQNFAVTVRIPELAPLKSLRFAARRSNKGIPNRPYGTFIMHRGVLVLPAVGPLDVVTLRSTHGKN